MRSISSFRENYSMMKDLTRIVLWKKISIILAFF